MNNAKINLVRFMESSRIENLASPVARGVPIGFYLLSSRLRSFNDLARRLTRAAEIAYGMRDVAALDEISQLLITLPLAEAQATGRYYLAVIAKRGGEIERACYELEKLVSCDRSPVMQARALLTLGTIFESQGNVSEAWRFYMETARMAVSTDGLALFGAYSQLSAIKSNEGDHGAALDDLETLWPVVRIAAQNHPHLYFQFHNEIAVELAAIGKLQEASEHSRIAMSTSLALEYPEWQATHTELEELLNRPVQVVATVPQPELEQVVEPAPVVLVIVGDLHIQDVTSTPLTHAGGQTLVLAKPFIISHPARAPPAQKAVSRLYSM